MFDSTVEGITGNIAPQVSLGYAFTQCPEAPQNPEAVNFMHFLAEDDAFRETFSRQPVATAARFGFTLDPARLPEDGIRLPSKSTIAKYLDDIAARFCASPQVIIHFII